MTTLDLKSHKSIQNSKRKIETLIVLIIALNIRCTKFVTIAKIFLRFLKNLRIRSISLIATKIANVNQCYEQFSTYVMKFLNTFGNLM